MIPSLPCIDIKSLQNRLLKVCFVRATSSDLPRVSFFFSFLLLLQPLTALMKQTRHRVHAVKQSIFLDVYAAVLPKVAKASTIVTVALKTADVHEQYWSKLTRNSLAKLFYYCSIFSTKSKIVQVIKRER
jgi:hypothetical protein